MSLVYSKINQGQYDMTDIFDTQPATDDANPAFCSLLTVATCGIWPLRVAVPKQADYQRRHRISGLRQSVYHLARRLFGLGRQFGVIASPDGRATTTGQPCDTLLWRHSVAHLRRDVHRLGFKVRAALRHYHAEHLPV